MGTCGSTEHKGKKKEKIKPVEDNGDKKTNGDDDIKVKVSLKVLLLKPKKERPNSSSDVLDMFILLKLTMKKKQNKH